MKLIQSDPDGDVVITTDVSPEFEKAMKKESWDEYETEDFQ